MNIDQATQKIILHEIVKPRKLIPPTIIEVDEIQADQLKNEYTNLFIPAGEYEIHPKLPNEIGRANGNIYVLNNNKAVD